MNRNYQKEMEKIIQEWGKESSHSGRKISSLLLHSCCAPCSSYVLEYLSKHFAITVFFYNPNISIDKEYILRKEEQKRLIEALNLQREEAPPIRMIDGEYLPEEFYQIAKGLETCPEGGERCFACYKLRLRKAVEQAVVEGSDYVTTTLTISPMKNAVKLNEIGEEAAKEFGAVWLPSDFKKKEGHKRSIELSAIYGLYRQDYCGCVYSKVERQKEKEKTK